MCVGVGVCEGVVCVGVYVGVGACEGVGMCGECV